MNFTEEQLIKLVVDGRLVVKVPIEKGDFAASSFAFITMRGDDSPKRIFDKDKNTKWKVGTTYNGCSEEGKQMYFCPLVVGVYRENEVCSPCVAIKPCKKLKALRLKVVLREITKKKKWWLTFELERFR